MKRILFAVTLLTLGATATLAADDGWVRIFNGKDLTGFEGDAKLWSVKDGAITLDFQDEITKGSCVTHGGEIINERAKQLVAAAK